MNTFNFWSKKFQGLPAETLTFADDLMTPGGVDDDPERSLDFYVVDLAIPDALYRLTTFTNGHLHMTSLALSELRNVIAPDTDRYETACLVNEYGRTVLVDGVSKGWVTVVRFNEFYDVICHSALNAACNYLAYVAARHRVPFARREVFTFFYPMEAELETLAGIEIEE